MHLAFIDIAYGYTADRPDADQPLGGTTSAVCYTARELVKAGINCTFFNKITEPAEACGIKSLPLSALPQAWGNPEFTAFIFCGRWLDDMVRFTRQATDKPLIAWMHESKFGNALVSPLPEFSGVIYVSEWQKRINQPYAHSHWKQIIIRNAMNPAAAHLFAADESVLAAKTKPPVLLFSGTAPRGVMHIPPILDLLRPKLGDFSVQLFCNTNPSGHAGQDEKYVTWLRSLPNVTHVGMVGQKELLQHMKRASILLSPNPWPETSCIAMIEAMAAGLSVVTTNRAALPETASGFARIVPIEDADDPTRFNQPVDHAIFAESVIMAFEELKNPATEQKRRAQIDYFLQHYQWHQRVGEWAEFL